MDDFVSESEILIKRIGDEIIFPIVKKPEEKKKEPETSNPLLVQPPYRPVMPPYYDDSRGSRGIIDPLRDIGRGDLDPFGRGGGMIFQPGMPYRPGGFGPLGPLNPGSLG